MEPSGCIKLCLECGELLVERAQACQTHRLDRELEFTARFVNGRRRANFDRKPVLEHDVEELRAMPENHAAHLRLRILEHKIAVTRSRAHEVRDLAAYPGETEVALDKQPSGADQQ